ncbi:MAG: hypothetical protein CMI61_09570 [Parvibaculum sp.]|nr:hypothetical protein [Parvibaculum sp.]
MLERNAAYAGKRHQRKAPDQVRLLERQDNGIRSEMPDLPRQLEGSENAAAEGQVFPVIDDLQLALAERGVQRIREPPSSAANAHDAKIVTGKKPALDKRQQPVLGAAGIKTVYEIENAQALNPG